MFPDFCPLLLDREWVIEPIDRVGRVDDGGKGDQSAKDDKEGERLPGEALQPHPLDGLGGRALMMRRHVLAEAKQVFGVKCVAVLIRESSEEVDDLLVGLVRVRQDPALPQQLGVGLGLQQPSHADGVGGDAEATLVVPLLERDEAAEDGLAVAVDVLGRDVHHPSHVHHLPLEHDV